MKSQIISDLVYQPFSRWWLQRVDLRQFRIILSFCLILLFSCQGKTEKTADQAHNDKGAEQIDSVRYAQGFRIETHPDYTVVSVRNPWDTTRILNKYILVSKEVQLPEHLPEGTLIRTPLDRVVSYSAVQCSVLSELGLLSSLVGVCEPQYIDIDYVQEGIRNKTITDIGMASKPDIEKLMLIEPEAVLASPLKDTGYGQATKLGIPFIDCVDYMESTPLGRAEWIRFHALFYNKEALADSLFQATVKVYNELKHLTEQASYRPTVLTEMRYGNIWYIPGGQSYVAHLLNDAGADYCWKDDTSTGSISLSFETVLDKAEKASFWLIKYNNPQDLAYKELAANYQPYTFFDAYKKKNIYTCNTGKVPYHEDLPIHPERILKDLVWIFHPELLPEYQPRYYGRME